MIDGLLSMMAFFSPVVYGSSLGLVVWNTNSFPHGKALLLVLLVLSKWKAKRNIIASICSRTELKNRRSSWFLSGYLKQLTNTHLWFGSHVYWCFNLIRLAFSVVFQPSFHEFIRMRKHLALFVSYETLKTIKTRLIISIVLNYINSKKCFSFFCFWSSDFHQQINQYASKITNC